MRYAIYARKSSEDKRRQVESISDQLKVLNALAEDKGLDVVKVFTESMAAKNVGRKQFNAMMQGFKKREYDAILTWDLDRLSRNMVDGGILMHMIQNGEIKAIHTPIEYHDCNSNMVYLAVKFGVATDQIIRLRKDVLRGMKSRVEQGYWYTQTPYGYTTKGRGVLEQNNQIRYVEMAYHLYSTGNYSLNSLAEHLNNSGMRTNTGNIMSTSVLHRILKSPVYKGEIHVQFKDEAEMMKVKRQHKQAVSVGLWEQVQERLDKKNPQKHATGKSKHYLFAKKLTCTCGSQMSCYKAKDNNYIECKNRACSQKFTYGKTSRKTLKETDLKNKVSCVFNQMELTGTALEYSNKAFKKQLQTLEQSQRTANTNHQQAIKDLENKLDKLTEKFAMDSIDEASYTWVKAKIIQEIDTKKQRMSDTKKNIDIPATIHKLSKICKQIKAAFDQATTDTQRKIFELLFQSLKPTSQALKIQFTELGNLLFYGYWATQQKPFLELSNTASAKAQSPFFDTVIPHGGPYGMDFELLEDMRRNYEAIIQLGTLVSK